MVEGLQVEGSEDSGNSGNDNEDDNRSYETIEKDSPGNEARGEGEEEEEEEEESSEAEEQQVIPPPGRKKDRMKYLVEGIARHDDEYKNTPHHLRSFRQKLGIRMESHPVQLAVLGLTVLDLIIVGVDLFLEEHFHKCYKEKGHHDDGAEIAEEILGWVSVAILCVLGLEISLIFFAFGLRFFKHPFYVLDAVVITLSLVFELYFKDAVGTLLIIFRLWRLVRVAHGVAMTIEEREEERIHVLEARNKHLINILESWKTTYNIVEPYQIEEGNAKKKRRRKKKK